MNVLKISEYVSIIFENMELNKSAFINESKIFIKKIFITTDFQKKTFQIVLWSGPIHG